VGIHSMGKQSAVEEEALEPREWGWQNVRGGGGGGVTRVGIHSITLSEEEEAACNGKGFKVLGEGGRELVPQGGERADHRD